MIDFARRGSIPVFVSAPDPLAGLVVSVLMTRHPYSCCSRSATEVLPLPVGPVTITNIGADVAHQRVKVGGAIEQAKPSGVLQHAHIVSRRRYEAFQAR